MGGNDKTVLAPYHAASHYRFAAGAWAHHDAFPSQDQKKAYDESLGGKPIDAYDPDHFLASLGLTQPLGAAGRTDAQMFEVESKADDFKPEPGYLPGPSWLASAIQSIILFFANICSSIGVFFSNLFGLATKDSDPSLPRWGESITSEKDPRPAAERYQGVAKKQHEAGTQLGFEANFHEGSIARESGEGFGTYDIAVSMGFDKAQAERIARSNYDVDKNETPFKDKDGKQRSTKGANGSDLHFHFNRADEGKEDTRLEAAKVHLERAIAAAKRGEYDAAERELGIGLHSLQDVFAHGQISPATHALLGSFPDHLAQDPVNAYEAQLATEGYLRKYLTAIGVGAAAPDLSQRPTSTAAKGRGVMPPAKLFAMGQLPKEASDVLQNEGLQFYLTDENLRPSALGFGFDADHNGAIEGDEALRTDGQSWNELPGGYDVSRKVGFIQKGASADVIRHELMHALVGAMMRDPKVAAAMQQTWQAYRDAGEFDFTPPSLQEFMADHLAKLDNQALADAIARLKFAALT